MCEHWMLEYFSIFQKKRKKRYSVYLVTKIIKLKIIPQIYRKKNFVFIKSSPFLSPKVNKKKKYKIHLPL